MSVINVLIADDHQIFRDGIISLFSNVEDVKICGVASNGIELLSEFISKKPDIILLDLSMHEMSGLEVIPKLKKLDPESRILVLSMHTSEFYIIRAVYAGVNGYLPKQNTNRLELMKAIRAIYNGESYFHESIAGIVTNININKPEILDEAIRQDYSLLTNREKEILKLVVEGNTNLEMAKKLFINIRTVETHKTNIMQKLGLKNNVEMVKFAIKNNLLEMEKL